MPFHPRPKAAVLFRGPIRPDAKHVHNSITDLMMQLDAEPVDLTVYLATWRTPEALRSLTEIAPEYIKSTIILDMPNILKIHPELNELRLSKSLSPAKNCFYQYYMSKIAIDMICNIGGYDLIVHTRPDLYIKLGSNIKDWLRKDNDMYRTIHTREDAQNSFINDQFSIARSEIMKSAWDYGSTDQLIEMIKASEKPEDVLQSLIDSANLKTLKLPIIECHLDPSRNLR